MYLELETNTCYAVMLRQAFFLQHKLGNLMTMSYLNDAVVFCFYSVGVQFC